ncbi:superinfection immunity protein [Vibrio anguillarum]|uniref:Superinfection immunity protein n=1 Tax=Vibrio anguillarum TaxID=55601 RepID=A0ABD4KVA3_VIBAN|nr:superinfection immunity protein [Vibrio anguillarum]MBF4274357.1 superinfection immunity protein [Vibrio anguillarum]
MSDDWIWQLLYVLSHLLGVSIGQLLLILIVLIPFAFLPSIIALKKNHPYKIPIVLINILGGLLWWAGWLIALIWCFIVPEKKAASIASVADELDKLHSLKERCVISEDEFKVK